MNPKIMKLPEQLINKIAAGEVVENPASIVKELVENSLDAGATHIQIDTIQGGYELIRIEDNGSGMEKEDALLSLQRHATSKIRSDEDLFKLSTMGFRGEALAAISSVCLFEMKTSLTKATHIISEGGKIIKEAPCVRNRGTTIEVRSLFYNVPARKKFQKSVRSSSAAIARVVETLAIAHPEIAFSFNGQEILPQSLQKRIEGLLGPYEIEIKEEDLFGYLGTPKEAMATRTGQYLFVNQRPVFSPLISRAIKEGFGTRIREQNHPRFVLFLNLKPHLVDVNVHPQKKEVRFRNEEEIFQKVKKAIEASFYTPSHFSEEITFQSPKESFSFPLSFASFDAKAEEIPLEWTTQEHPLAVIGRFLLLQKEDVFLVDLKAAYARVLFDSLQKETKTSQALLIPLQIPVLPEEESKIPSLEALGVECRLLKKTLVIDALPPFLEASDFPEFYKQWKEDQVIDRMISRFCLSLKRQFSMEEALHLFKEVQKCKDPMFDPKGNPIFCKILEENLLNLLKSSR